MGTVLIDDTKGTVIGTDGTTSVLMVPNRYWWYHQGSNLKGKTR